MENLDKCDSTKKQRRSETRTRDEEDHSFPLLRLDYFVLALDLASTSYYPLTAIDWFLTTMTATTAGEKDGDTPSLNHGLVMSVRRQQEEPFLLRRTNNRMIVTSPSTGRPETGSYYLYPRRTRIVHHPVLAGELVQVIPVLLGPTFLLLGENNRHDQDPSRFWEHRGEKNAMTHTLETLEMALELLDEDDEEDDDDDHHHHHLFHGGAGNDKQQDYCDRHDDKVR
jgi:hypothetical protein